MISLTESAAEKLKKLLETRDDIGVRPAVQGGGCSGFKYKLEFVKSESDRDKIIEKVLIPLEILALDVFTNQLSNK